MGHREGAALLLLKTVFFVILASLLTNGSQTPIANVSLFGSVKWVSILFSHFHAFVVILDIFVNTLTFRQNRVFPCQYPLKHGQ